MMYVLEYLIYHLKPYGVNSVTKIEMEPNKKEDEEKAPIKIDVVEKTLTAKNLNPKPVAKSTDSPKVSPTTKGTPTPTPMPMETTEEKKTVAPKLDIPKPGEGSSSWS